MMASLPNEVASTSAREKKIPKRYGLFRHDFKSLFDMIFSLIFPLLAPLHRLAPQPHTAKQITPKDQRASQKIRKKTESLEVGGVPWALYGWSIAAGSPIAEFRLRVPRNGKILKEWNITSKLLVESSDGAVEAIVRFPLRLLPEERRNAKDLKKLSNGCVEVTKDDFVSAAKKEGARVALYLHGGGLVLGTPDDSLAILSQMGFSSADSPGVILVSVEYRLAPDHPFPAAPIDCFTTIDYLMNAVLPTHSKLHIMGVSAGGYLGVISALEASRMFPGRVASVSALSPMVSPSCDTLSYYQNDEARGVCPTNFLRWCWAAYLQLPTAVPDPQGNPDEEDVPLSTLLRRSSHFNQWHASPWFQDPTTRRLIDPVFSLQEMSKDPSIVFPDKVAICTTKADALHDEGQDLVEAFRKNLPVQSPAEMNERVISIEANGSHVFGLMFDLQAARKVNQTLASIFCGEKDTKSG